MRLGGPRLSVDKRVEEGREGHGNAGRQAAGRRNTKVPDSWSVPFRPPIHSCSTICRMDKETRKRKTTRSYSATRSIAEIQRQYNVKRESFENDYYLRDVEVYIFWQNLSRNRVSWDDFARVPLLKVCPSFFGHALSR